MAAQDFDLPALNPLLKLYKAAESEGEPSWTLHNPIANTYFNIAWAEFECLARFSRVKSAVGLIELVKKETPIGINFEDVKELVIFLHSNGLLALSAKAIPFTEKTEPFWKKILHGYLYFTIPLFTPDSFLKRTLPYVRPFLSKTFILLMMSLFVVGFIMTMQRVDEFTHSFSKFFSLEGIIQGLIVLGFIKIVHEMAHAYTAVKYGVPVPHMGVAVIVMYPVLYTETTGGWQISSRRERFHIAIAGITAELYLAALFLILWNIMPAGSAAQGLAFTVVTISLIGSLVVNLNPLMRFDGYYMMSELMGIDNLQQRACNFARWKIREVLFALGDATPEALPADKQRFLIWFGIVLLVYRFFLFFGISLLVYHIFFKPLGLILMLVELVWFIGLPVLSEIQIWWQRRGDIIRTMRSKIALGVGVALLVVFVLPWQSTVYMPAIMHAENSSAVYPYTASYIEELSVKEGQMVSQGDILARLSSFDLEKSVETTRQKLENLRMLQRRMRTDPALLQEKYAAIDLEIQMGEQKLKSLEDQGNNLVVTAPFSGRIRDLEPDIKAGRYVKKTDLLFRIVGQESHVVVAYADENDVARLSTGNEAVFIPDSAPFSSVPLRIETLSDTGTSALPWPELSTLHQGGISAEVDQQTGQIVALRSLYAVNLQPVAPANLSSPEMVWIGEVRAEGRHSSALIRFINRLIGLAVRESGLN